MADIDLKTATPDTSLPTTGFLFGADSQASASPSVYSTQTVATTLLGSTSLTGATITADAPVLNLAQTWNAGAVTFTGLKFNATDTASAAGSLLMDLQVGGGSKFSVTKAGSIILASNQYIQGLGFTSDALGGTRTLIASSTIAQVRSNMQIGWGSSNTDAGGVMDTILTRRAAANLRFGAADAAAPVAQTLSVQSGTAGASALSCSISGTTLTVGGAVTGTIAIGHAVTGTDVSAGTVITAGSGTSWTVNNSQTVSSTTMYFNSVGQNLTITGSQGSGPSAGGSIVFQVAPAGSAATTAQNALATALTIDSTRNATFSNAIISGSGAGNGLYFGSTSGVQIYSSASSSLFISLGGGTFGFSRESASTGAFCVDRSLQVASDRAFQFSSTTAGNGSPDVFLARDAANTLALRNGANAQTFRVYNTTDGTNSEFGTLTWASTANRFIIGTSSTGTGAVRTVQLGAGNGFISLETSSTGRVDAYVGQFTINTTAGTERLRVDANGLLTFGGTTSSFPALKRSSTTLQARLADDSAFAPVQGKLTTDTAYAAGDPTTTGYLVVYDSTGTAYKIPAVAV